MERKIYQAIASRIAAAANCRKSGNAEWMARHIDVAELLTRDHMPSGGGFDNGTRLDVDASTAERLVFTTSFHHMNDSGSYDGWTDHSVIVTPSLAIGFSIRVNGRNWRDINTYIGDTFSQALDETELQPAVA